MDRISRGIVLCAVAGVVVAGAIVSAGPLNPAAGPVASTYKTLTEVEPRIAINLANTPGDDDSLFKITQPGSYYLTGNISGVAGKHGIEIAASNVTIDLSGFAMTGVAGSLDGITSIDYTLVDITVRNGTVRTWGNQGLDFSNATGVVVESVLVRECAMGIRIGDRARVRLCTASNNSGSGFFLGVSSQVVECTAENNQINGIFASDGSMIINCVANANTGAGIRTNSNAIIRGCVAQLNTSHGVMVHSNTVVSGVVSSANGFGASIGAGILAVGNANRLEDNVCNANDRGIDVDGVQNIIIRNTCSANALNWTFVGGNHYGPIIDRTAVAAPPSVNGNSATEALGSTHPNANFTN
ncbi:MAG: right-handed parallel beta-helix repeat-containing protein [Planctomycetota bacterium]|nr:right-handed parallel beta-helix repeat-containing protein [Planctomycetota bacterium]